MIPIKDDNPTRHVPAVTIAIIALNAIAWVFVQGLGAPASLLQSVFNHGLIPGELLGTVDAGTRVPVLRGVVYVVEESPNWLSLVSSMFMHGGWLHLIGNMWFLGIFGNNVEEAMGSVRFAAFYLISGLAASAAQMLASPASTAPMVGASGAIGGVMGAYALLFPRVGVHMLVILGFYVTTIAVPAVLMLGYWFVIQILAGVLRTGGGVAVWAHVGGFVAGLLLVKPFVRADRMQELQSRRRPRQWRSRWG